MEIVASNALINPLAIFSIGTVFGASSVYYFLCLRRRALNAIRTVPIEEKFQTAELEDEYRLIMGIRSDLKMQKGKVAAQCGHAAVAAYAKAQRKKPQLLSRWMRYGGTKITVKLDSEQELLDLDKKAKASDVLSSIVRDAGQTQVAPGSRTVIAIGPAPKSVLAEITGHLKLY